MTIFNFVNDILYKKTGKLINKNELESEFQPFMIQRWLSMYSNRNVIILNKTVNRIHKSISDKQQWYKLFLGMIPKSNYKKLNYIKKVKKEKKEKSEMELAIELVAKVQKLSTREVTLYVEEYDLDLSSIAKTLKQQE